MHLMAHRVNSSRWMASNSTELEDKKTRASRAKANIRSVRACAIARQLSRFLKRSSSDILISGRLAIKQTKFYSDRTRWKPVLIKIPRSYQLKTRQKNTNVHFTTSSSIQLRETSQRCETIIYEWNDRLFNKPRENFAKSCHTGSVKNSNKGKF